MARLIDGYERAVARLGPRPGFNPWHAAAGAAIGLCASALGLLPLLVETHSGWQLIPVCGALGALAFMLFARADWNRLYAQYFAPLRAQAATNLCDHELLLLMMEDDLPARFEKLRYVAQSHGKTRARNYAELRKGSMADRVTWLVENYTVICRALGLPHSLPALRARDRRALWLFLSPLGLLVAAIAGMMALAGHGGIALAKFTFPAFSGITMLLMSCGALVSGLQAHLERAALLSVLVEVLDLTDPQPVAGVDEQLAQATADSTGTATPLASRQAEE